MLLKRYRGQNKPTGRNKITPIASVHAFTFKSDKESQFLHSEKDYRITTDKFYLEKDYEVTGIVNQIDETRKPETEDDIMNSDVQISKHQFVKKMRRELY